MFTEYIKVFSKSVLFNGILDVELEAMLGCIQPRIREYKKGEFITAESGEFEGIGIILKGEAIASKENAFGNRIMMMNLHPGGMFGEIVAFLDKPRWPVTIEAQGACIVAFLHRDKILGQCERVCDWHNTMIRNMLKILSQRAMMLNKKVDYLALKSMRGKICTYLIQQYKEIGAMTFMIPMNRNELADFLNVSRPSMSRELARMKDEGVIDFHLSSFRILNLEALKGMIL